MPSGARDWGQVHALSGPHAWGFAGPARTAEARTVRQRRPRAAAAPGGRGGRGGGRAWAEVSPQRPRVVPAAAALQGLADDAFSARRAARGEAGTTVASPARAAQKSGRGGNALTRHAEGGPLPKLSLVFGDLKAEQSVREPPPGHPVGTRPSQSTPPKRPRGGPAPSSGTGRGRAGPNRKSLSFLVGSVSQVFLNTSPLPSLYGVMNHWTENQGRSQN